MEKHIGIVLKTFFPKKMKIMVLDSQLGKIEAVPTTDTLSCGSLLSYCVQPKGSLYFLNTIALLDMPLMLARNDILFIHHVLELCYFCAPFNASIRETFDLVHQLYNTSIKVDDAGFKIAFLFKLLITLGMHPDEPRFQDPYYYVLGRESIDTIRNKSIQLETKQALYEWVRSCVLVHPLIHAFKTVHFLDTDRLL